MAYRIDPTAALDAEFRRVALEQNRKAAAALADADLTLDEAAFAARRHLKKLRGLLRLVRPADSRFAGSQNARYRATGRLLSRIRDDAMLGHALAALAEAGLAKASIADILARLAAAKADSKEAASKGAGEDRRRALALVAEGRAGIEAFVLAPDRKIETIVARGVAETYRRGRRLLKTASRTGAESHLHALRGEAKRHWMHLRLLQPLWPEMMEPAAAEAKALADDLGADHDQTVLRAALAMLPGTARGPAADAAILSERRSEALRERALRDARRLYADRPKAVEARIGRLFRLARGR